MIGGGMKSTPPAPLILGHRGYRARFPENTFLAFREALGAGADGIECDLQKTADGRYVVIHDSTTERVTGVGREVSRSRLEDLQGLDFGKGESIPTLEELLPSLPVGAWLDLELKEETLVPADCERIASILQAHRARLRLMVSSFAPSLLAAFRKMGFVVGWLVGEEAAGMGILGFAGSLLRLRPQYVNLPVDMIGILGRNRARLLFRILHRFGFSLLFWTVNSEADAAFLAPHARIIVTDEVELLVRAIRT
jgi:glycerophosphoryl diester phosphodiesterase